MTAVQRAYIELHVAVLLYGLTAILGDLIQLTALSLVWWRVLITSLSLLFLIRVFRLFKEIPARVILQFMGIGVLVAMHWVCFYGAIKLANASISLICMATTSLFTSILEPLIMQTKVKGYELILGLLIIPGMILIVNNVDFSMMNGIWVGLLAAALAALFGTLNKKMVGKTNEKNITFLELGSAWIFLSFVLPLFVLFSEESIQFWPSTIDWIYLIILSLLCTTLAYILSLRALHHLSAFAANLTINLEPVYGIILAFIFLNDHKELNLNFYFGVGIILFAVFSYPFLRKRFQPK
jgi:drug/metabolite transporter (DMT)-like permease